MTVSRNDILSKLGDAIYPLVSGDPEGSSDDPFIQSIAASCLDALSEFVIFLPEDAEPEQFDIIDIHYADGSDNLVYCTGELEEDLPDEDHTFKIIQRNSKPVITIKSEANNG